LTALLGAAALMLTLGACGGQGEAAPDGAPTASATSSATGGTAAATEDAASGTAQEDPATVAADDPEPASPAVAAAPVRVASLKGPTTMALADLMNEPAWAQDFQVTMYGTPDEITGPLIQGEIDVALIPANLAAVLYNNTGGAVQVAGVSALGVLHVLAKGVVVTSLADLAGQTVWSTGKGNTPQYVLEYLLAQAGVADQVTVEYLSQSDEVAAKLVAADSGIGVLPQPYATVVALQDPAVTEALDLTEQWNLVSPDSALVTAVVVVRAAYAAENPQRVADFLSALQQSVAYTEEEPAAAAELIAELGLTPSAAIAEAALPGAHLVALTGAEAKAAVGGYLQVLFDANPDSVGGAVPGDAFYYAP
jgi:NitT/TauT family transport system substrate-binding protein